MDLEIEGLEQFTERIQEMANTRALERAMGKACAIVERDAIKNAPKDHGDLRRSIQSKVENDGHEVVGTVFTPLEYAPYVEYGTGLFAESGNGRQTPWKYKDDEDNWHTTKGQHPQPFMRPALSENKQNILRVVKKVVFND